MQRDLFVAQPAQKNANDIDILKHGETPQQLLKV